MTNTLLMVTHSHTLSPGISILRFRSPEKAPPIVSSSLKSSTSCRRHGNDYKVKAPPSYSPLLHENLVSEIPPKPPDPSSYGISEDHSSSEIPPKPPDPPSDGISEDLPDSPDAPDFPRLLPIVVLHVSSSPSLSLLSSHSTALQSTSNSHSTPHLHYSSLFTSRSTTSRSSESLLLRPSLPLLDLTTSEHQQLRFKTPLHAAGSQLFPPVTSPTGPPHLKPTSSLVSSMNLSHLLRPSLTITAQDLDSRSTTQGSNYTHTGTATLGSVYNRRQTWLQDPIPPNLSRSETHSTTRYQQPPRFTSMSCYSAASLQFHIGVSSTAASNGYQIQPPAFQKRYGNRTLPLVSGELLLRSQVPAHLSDVTTLITVDRTTIPVRVCGKNPSRGTLFHYWATPDMGFGPQLLLLIQNDIKTSESNKSISSQEPTLFKARTETGIFKTALVAALSIEFQHLHRFLDFQSLVSLLNGNGDVNEPKNILSDIHSLIEPFSFISFSYVTLSSLNFIMYCF